MGFVSATIRRMPRNRLVILCGFLILVGRAPAQNPPEWSRPFEPLHIVGNLYYVGTYDLAVYLITTPEGHFLINTGLDDTVEPIRRNVENVGFKLDDVKFRLEMQAHCPAGTGG